MTTFAAGFGESQDEMKDAYAAHLDVRARAAAADLVKKVFPQIEQMLEAIKQEKATLGDRVRKEDACRRILDAEATVNSWIFAIETAFLCAAARHRNEHGKIVRDSQPAFKRFKFYESVPFRHHDFIHVLHPLVRQFEVCSDIEPAIMSAPSLSHQYLHRLDRRRS